jgi:hypothetical protein
MDLDPEPSPWRAVSVTLATEGQTREKVTELVTFILGRAGCHTCGRLIKFDADFAVDPGPEAANHGATSVSFS